MVLRSITVGVPANIALIKYWGKRDENLILPLNDSVSLNVDSLRAETSLTVDEDGRPDTVSINGQPVDLAKKPRFGRVFEESRRLIRKRLSKSENDRPPLISFHVVSTTTFPVAAGLASSAAGFGAIALAIGRLFSFSDEEISRIARLGSGSACRSVFGGLVHWKAGQSCDGGDCYAERVRPPTNGNNGDGDQEKNCNPDWPDLRAVIVVLDGKEKEIGSSIGMRNSVRTSELLTYRASHVVKKRVASLVEAYWKRDFPSLANIIMSDSNQFHAICLDTMPPLKYMSEQSWDIIRIVEEFNQPEIRAAYTFDAGPNACVFMDKSQVAGFLSALTRKFSVSREIESSIRGSACVDLKSIELFREDSALPVVSDVIVSSVGNGPYVSNMTA